MDLSIDQIAYLKACLDTVILEEAPEFEYPCYFSWPDISEEEHNDLQEKELIGWHDGWQITNDGVKAFHAQKHKLPYYTKDYAGVYGKE